MTLKKQFLLLFLLLCQFISAQQGSVTVLDEVFVSDVQLNKFSNSQSVLKLKDSILSNNKTSLTNLLNYNSTIYFKENGLGMVSSPSFRGTTAQQTAVIWNGININSQLNGQTDFNTISIKDFNSISIRAGGGSSVYGSSAIGGSIHLNNDFIFGNKFENTLRLNYGSFNTLGANYKMLASTTKFCSQISISRNSSDNDYPYLNTDKKNENGQFYSTSLNVNFGYKLDSKNSLKFYSYWFDSERHFSGTLTAPSKSKYNDYNTRNLMEWVGNYHRFISKTKVAFLSEEYKYFENAVSSNFSFGKANTFIAKYDLSYKVNSKLEINSILDYTQTKGFGSDIEQNIRQIGSGILLFRHKPFTKFLYEITVRKEITSNYKSPVLFSVGTNFAVFSFYNLKINSSRNYRIPTFNDLYWKGSGNINLKPESSLQFEVGHQFQFKNISFSLTNYYIKIQDLLRWLPSSGGIWIPINTSKVSTYGTEFLLNYYTKFGKNNIAFTTTYAYTISKDEVLNKQLIYVPFHKFTSALSYSYAQFSTHYQFLYNGKVFTSSDNYYKLNDYLVSNVGIDYKFGKKKFIQLGFDVFNIFNKNYQSVSMRPMPGRNFTINITLNF